MLRTYIRKYFGACSLCRALIALLLSRSVTEDAWASKDIEYIATTADYIVPIVAEVMVRERDNMLLWYVPIIAFEMS